jgi:hypothetical protein
MAGMATLWLADRLQTAFAFLKPYWADRRIRVATGLALLLTSIAWYWFIAGTATLTVAGRHSFRQAEISIWVDGDLKSKFEVSGSARKKLGVFQKIDGSFSRSLRVGAGEHTVRVRVHALPDGGEIVRQCQANVQSGTESAVYVNADRGVLSLGFASGASRSKPEPESSSSGYVKMMQSVLMAIAGSALSATVGFLVQDFLKARKGTNAQAQAPSANSAD